MAIPVYVVTGFLDAGKTTFLNALLNRPDWRDGRLLVLQFENGEEEFRSRYQHCLALCFPKKLLERQPEQIVGEIYRHIQEHWQKLDEIWIEWNGVVPLSTLQALLLQEPLRGLCKLQKVMHIADAASVEALLGRTGSALPEQIASSDFAVVRNVSSTAAHRRVRRLLNGINPGIDVCEARAGQDLYKLLSGRRDPVSFFFLGLALLAVLYFAAMSLSGELRLPFNAVINVFLGIILQAVPFLLIGVLLSSAIQVFIPQSLIERRFPKSPVAGMLVAILGGFCLPVCDCASIPIFRSLVKKGIPLPAAVTFMTAAPVVNPVAILSTYYAFGGNLTIVLGRVCLGAAAAAVIGLLFAVRPPKGEVLSGGALDRLMCGCGCYEGAEAVTSFSGKLGLFIRHSQAEFFSVGKYLLVGSLIASVFQAMGTGVFTAAQSGAGRASSILIMMAMAFVLSLCSSSDAVIARSFANQFPMSAIMGFLVFGPMMDVKNVMMLSSGFSKRWIGRLFLTAWVVCFAVVFLFSGLGGI